MKLLIPLICLFLASYISARNPNHKVGDSARTQMQKNIDPCSFEFKRGYHCSGKKDEEKSTRSSAGKVLKPDQLPESQVSLSKRNTRYLPHEGLQRVSRGFRSAYYNYLDEMAMSICAALPSEGPSLMYAVRRTCGEKPTCKDICQDRKLREQGPKEVQSLQWTCTESLHVYKRQPELADNYEEYTDSHKLGLAIYRHHSCTIGGCGPNYCCCRAS